jgi:hypothetical protein
METSRSKLAVRTKGMSKSLEKKTPALHWMICPLARETESPFGSLAFCIDGGAKLKLPAGICILRQKMTSLSKADQRPETQSELG